MNVEGLFAFCEVCVGIKSVRVDDLVGVSECGKYEGGDIVCNKCDYVVATIFNKRKKKGSKK